MCDNKANQFKFSNYVGRNLSRDCGDARAHGQVLEHMKKTYGSKMKEWAAEPLKQEMGGQASDNGDKTGVNGMASCKEFLSNWQWPPLQNYVRSCHDQKTGFETQSF